MDFESWWKAHGQFCRAGGGEYEKTFAYWAWQAAAEAAAHRLEEEAKYGCPCNEDERLTWENADLLREWAGLPKRNTETPNV